MVLDNLVSEKSLGFGIGKFGLGKKVLVLVSEKKYGFRFRRIWSRKKSLGFGFRKFGLGKKSIGFGFGKFGLGKKVSVSVLVKI